MTVTFSLSYVVARGTKLSHWRPHSLAANSRIVVSGISLALVRGPFVTPGGGAGGQCVTIRTMIFKRQNGWWVINGHTWEDGNVDQIGRVRRKFDMRHTSPVVLVAIECHRVSQSPD